MIRASRSASASSSADTVAASAASHRVLSTVSGAPPSTRPPRLPCASTKAVAASVPQRLVSWTTATRCQLKRCAISA